MSARAAASVRSDRRSTATIGLVTVLCAFGILAAPWRVRAETLSDVFERVSRSVVVVRTVERDISEDGDGVTRVTAFGSGVLVSRDGLVMTAAHVVNAASVVQVEFATGDSVPARIVASEPSADVSLLRVEWVPRGAVVATVADSDRTRIGEQVFVVGAPYGLSRTLTVGHLSGRLKPGQVFGRFDFAEFLQTDAAINQGNSGGPLFSTAGEVIGIVSHLISKSGGFEGLGFVVASNTARRLLLEQPVPWSGIDAILLEGDMLRVFNLPAPGLLIQPVAEDSPDSMFDSQVKRIHEYKRQLLNALRIVVLYNRLRKNPDLEMAPRTFLFAGKAAPAYHLAKLIIKLVNNIAATVDGDPVTRGRLNVLFLPEYSVSLAERLIPASDVSNQISTAGYEASGTSNMKFMMNGTLTIGTRDGATIEMAEEAGEDNFFLFGLDAHEVAASRGWYNPRWHYDNQPEVRDALDLIFSDHFSPNEPGIFAPLRETLLTRDYYMHLADLESYLDADARLCTLYADGEAWTRKAILNVASSGKFSSDRTIAEYAAGIWDVKPCPVP